MPLNQPSTEEKTLAGSALALLRRAWANPQSRWSLILFVLALVARAAWVAYADRPPLGLNDPVRYDALAQGIAAGDGYRSILGYPTAYYPIGYPAVLAAVYAVLGHSILWAKMLNALLGAATVVITYELARRLLGHPVARIAGLLLALFPNQVFYAGTILSEVLFTFLLMSGLLILMAEPWPREGIGLPRLTFAGLFLAAATMVRPILLPLPIILLVFWLFVHPHRVRILAQVGVVVLLMALFVVPWSIRNAVRMDAFILISTNAGDDFCIGNHEGATGGFVMTGPCFEGYEDVDQSEAEVVGYREGIKRGLRFIVNHPLEELRLLPNKARYLLERDDDGLRATESYDNDPFIEKGLRRYLAAVANGYYFLVIAGAALGLFSWFRHRDARKTLCLVMLAYLLAVPLVFFGDPRFHFPVIPLLCMLAAAGMMATWRRLRPHQQQGGEVSSPVAT